MSSYAEASIRGAAQPDGENTVPIESVNISPQEVKAAIDNKPESDDDEEELKDEVKAKAKEVEKEAKKEAKKAKKAFKKSIDELEANPAASSGALAVALAAIATTIGVVHTKKNNATITPQQGALVGAGIALVSTGYYFFLTKDAASSSKK